MIMDITTKIGSFEYLQKGLEVASIRHEVISNNIANVETPKFKKSVVAFENILKEAIGNEHVKRHIHRTHAKHLPGDFKLPDPKVIQVNTTNMRNDLNNVDIDQEMALLTKNTIVFQTLSEQMNRKFNTLKSVINGGR